MNMVKTRSADKDFYLLESFITIFAFEESLERFALQFGVPDTRAQSSNAFLKSEWQMTNDAVILYQNAMKIEMPNRSAFPQKTSLSFLKNISACFQNFFFLHAILTVLQSIIVIVQMKIGRVRVPLRPFPIALFSNLL